MFTTLLQEWAGLAVTIGVIAFTYREVLAKEPILNWWFQWGFNFEKRFFYRPIWGCAKCFAGQLAFWSYLFIAMVPSSGLMEAQIFTFPDICYAYRAAAFAIIFGHLFTICGAITVTVLLQKIISR